MSVSNFTAKDIVIKSIDSASARRIVKLHHYSGKTTQNSQIHFGVFLNGKLEGALQFGPSINKRGMVKNFRNLVGFNEFLELNRMALSDKCPKNSESRAIGICMRILRKKYPHLKLIVSFADACQCGDGTIYRASGFKLHSFKKNTSQLVAADGTVVSDKSFNNLVLPNGQRLTSFLKNKDIVSKKTFDNIYLSNGKQLTAFLQNGFYKPLEGYQMKYIYFFDKQLEKQFDFVPFDKIPDEVKMYKGSRRIEHEDNASGFQSEEGGSTPTDSLQL